MRPHAAVVVPILFGATAPLQSQSAHLLALEGSVPPAVVDPLAGAFSAGLAGLWSDPTVAPHATGALLGLYHSSYASVRLFHGVTAFEWGPRWSLTYGSTEITGLFDTSLTNQDPGLANLRARAVRGGLDATVSRGGFVGSAGIAIAGDDNVGEFETATIGRLHTRFTLPGNSLSFGAGWSAAIGGSLEARPGGRGQIDALIDYRFGAVDVAIAAAYSTGAIWRYSETVGGAAVAAHVTILSRVALGVGIGRYATAFGGTTHEWQRSITGGLILNNIRVNVRYSSTKLGLGSGYGVSFAYEPGSLQIDR